MPAQDGNERERDLHSPSEIAELAGVSKYSVLRWVRAPVRPLPTYRLSRSTILISRAQFLAWLEAKRTVPDVERIAAEAVLSLTRSKRGS